MTKCYGSKSKECPVTYIKQCDLPYCIETPGNYVIVEDLCVNKHTCIRIKSSGVNWPFPW